MVYVLDKLKDKSDMEVIARAKIIFEDGDIDEDILLSVFDIKRIYGIHD